MSSEFEHMEIGVDQDTRRSVTVSRDAVSLPLRGGFDAGCLGRLWSLGNRGPLFRRQIRRRRLQAERGRRAWLPEIDFVLLVQRLEQIGERADSFGRAQEQTTFGFERVVEGGNDLLLPAGLKVDQ